jgi:hypothetical protein
LLCVPGCRFCLQSSSSSTQLVRVAAAAQRYGLALLVKLYPYAHAVIEGVKFNYQLSYLLDVLDCHSPTLHLLGQRLVRLSGAEMVRACYSIYYNKMYVI